MTDTEKKPRTDAVCPADGGEHTPLSLELRTHGIHRSMREVRRGRNDMTGPTDPRIEAVAKLLFTGPIFQNRLEDWDSQNWARGKCLMAAEDVLRGIDEAAEWEYGSEVDGEPEAGITEGEPVRGQMYRRRPAGPWEPLP